MTQRYPRAVDLAQMAHCSVCGETNPITDDGGETTCCARRECPGMGPEAQDVCCQALQDRVDHEAVYGTPASPLSVSAQAGATAPRSTRIDETRRLHYVKPDANLVSHQGAVAPTTTDPKEPAMALSTAAAPAELPDGTPVRTPEGATGTTKGAPVLTAVGMVVSVEFDAEFAHLSPSGGFDYRVEELEVITAEPAADEAPAASNWDGDRYMGYDVLAAAKGRTWHVGPRNDDTVCHAETDGKISLSEAVAKPLGICAKCSRYLDKHGAYVPYAERVAAAPAPAPAAPAAAPKGARPSLGASSAIGWDLLYDKPKAGAEIGRRYVDGKPEFALICKEHGITYRLRKLSDEGKIRREGGWCSACPK